MDSCSFSQPAVGCEIPCFSVPRCQDLFGRFTVDQAVKIWQDFSSVWDEMATSAFVPLRDADEMRTKWQEEILRGDL